MACWFETGGRGQGGEGRGKPPGRNPHLQRSYSPWANPAFSLGKSKIALGETGIRPRQNQDSPWTNPKSPWEKPEFALGKFKILPGQIQILPGRNRNSPRENFQSTLDDSGRRGRRYAVFPLPICAFQAITPQICQIIAGNRPPSPRKTSEAAPKQAPYMIEATPRPPWAGPPELR